VSQHSSFCKQQQAGYNDERTHSDCDDDDEFIVAFIVIIENVYGSGSRYDMISSVRSKCNVRNARQRRDKIQNANHDTNIQV
jgi:hypothetical protein